jgi:hypothetical protein
MLSRQPWHFGRDIKGRDYLIANQSFESLVEEIVAAVGAVDQSRVRFAIEPEGGKYTGSDRLLKRLRCRRTSWTIPLDGELLDKFFNGLMGIRAQYYVSPYHGRAQNALLISGLRGPLLELAGPNDPANAALTKLSLDAPSAKTWIAERNRHGTKILRTSDPTLSEEEIKNDWLQTARALKAGAIEANQYQVYVAALSGVQAPIADQFVVKGGWITAEDRCEYVTPDKRDRDMQLFMFGFT